MTTPVTISPVAIQQFFDNAGRPCAGGSVLTQVASVNYATWQDSAGSIPLPNPIPLNSRGEISNAAGVSCQLFLQNGIDYTFTLFDANGNQLNQATYVASNDLIASLASSAGAGEIGYSATASYGAATVGSKLQQIIAVTDPPFNAVCDGVTDDLAAAQAAQAASLFVYIPQGKKLYVSAAVNYWQFFGTGTMVMGGQTINLPPYPKTGAAIYAYNPATFGSYENAVAASFTINSGSAQLKNNTQVNGTSGSGYATTPIGIQRDHVAVYMFGGPGVAVVTGASSVYTSNTLTAAEIGTAAAGAIKPGMIVDTKHAGVFTGTVQSVSGSTITVDAWWLQGPAPTAGTPANGTGATINPTTVSFGANAVVSTSTTGTDAASGFELDIAANNATGANATIAVDAIGAGTQSGVAAYRARSKWQIGYYATGANVAIGHLADTTPVGFEARDCSSNGYQSRVSGVVKWSVNSLGLLQGDYRNVTVNAAGAYSIAAGDSVIVNVSGAAVLTLPAVTGLAGRCYTVVANAATVVKNQAAATIKSMSAGTSALFACDGSFWY